MATVFKVDMTAAGVNKVIVREAQKHCEQTQAAIAQTQDSPLPPIMPCQEIDVYAELTPETTEIELYYDAISTKKQPDFRADNPSGQKMPEDTPKRVNTDVAVLQLPDGSFQTILPGMIVNGQLSYTCLQNVQHSLKIHYNKTDKPLRLVAITDRATCIRNELTAYLSADICIILDWYHLQKKTKTLVSLLCKDKANKKAHIAAIKNLLWEGKTTEALAYLSNMSIARQDSYEELYTYLNKHQAEIVNYKRRQAAGRTIGSGRGEKANDTAIAQRQKNNGMAWTDNGSRALAILAIT